MRKSLFIGLVAILGLIGCSRNQEIDVPDANLSIFAKTESPAETKTLVESGVHVYWEPGDEIAVFTGEQSAKFTTDITAASGTATFKGTFGDATWPDDLDLWAVYPFSEEAVFDGETITTTLPSEQVAREGSFGKDMNLAIAHSNSSTLQFYNVGGGIRFSVTEEGIKKAMFEGLSGEIISGKVKIGMDENGKPVVQEVTGGSQFITLLPPTGQESFEPGFWYYIVAIPGALEKGYKLRFYKETDYARKVSEKAVEIKRSIYGNIEKADEEIEYKPQTTHFPETLEEIKESISISNEISKAIELIQLPLTAEGTVDIHQFETEITKIDGVISCEVGDGDRLLIVQQIDSSFINVVVDPVFHPENDDNIFPNEIQSFLSQNMAAMNRSQCAFPTNKKAVLLAPFNSTGETKIPANEFVIEGFLNCVGISLKTYLDDKADLEAFSLENLSQYDVILIKTHGLSGASTVKGDISTILETGQDVVTFSLQGFLNNTLPSYSKFAKCIIKTSNGSSDRYCITVPWLEKQASSGLKLPNSYVWAGACQSYMADDLKQCFFEIGASAFSGFKETVSTAINGYSLHRILNLMAFGAGLRYASDYYLSNLKDATTMREYLMEDCKDSPTYDHLLYDYCFNTDKDIDDYYLIDSTPHPLGHTPLDISENNSYELLFWNIDKPSTYTGVPYLYYRPDGVTPIDIPVLYLTTEFDIYIDGNKYCTTGNYSISIDKADFTTGDHHWFVVTKIKNGNEICASFKSAEDHFTVEKEHKYATPEPIDLGLPSGLKWASFNLGASKPEEYGKYFAWGETAPKQDYKWSTYKWCMGEEKTIIKYCIDSNCGYNGFTDGKTVLDLDDDAAAFTLADQWRMPTEDERDELRSFCSWEWASISNVNGYKVTGPNGNSIFIPAAGYRYGDSSNSVGSYGFYWTSSLSTISGSDTSHPLSFGPDFVAYGSYQRYFGLPIRPVYDDYQTPQTTGDIESTERDPWN